jgi:hypothetical protein
MEIMMGFKFYIEMFLLIYFLSSVFCNTNLLWSIATNICEKCGMEACITFFVNLMLGDKKSYKILRGIIEANIWKSIKWAIVYPISITVFETGGLFIFCEFILTGKMAAII